LTVHTRRIGPRLHRTFASLGVRNYRLFFLGQLVSVSGTWMQTVAQSFLVLRLTNSGTQLGLTTAARFAPLFLLGPWGGVILDRLDTRRLLYATQVVSAALAFVFGVLVATGLIDIWAVYVLALGLGCVNVFDTPARQTFLSELVAPEYLQNAVTLNSVTVNLARIAGAALGGVLTATLGLALCFVVNGLSFLVVVLSLVLMTGADLVTRSRQPAERGQVRAGVRYVASEPELYVPLLMIAVVGALAWEFPVSLPLLAANTFHGDAGTYGAMVAAMGVGAVVGGLVTASRSRSRARSLSVAALGWGSAITVAALAPTLRLEYAALLFVGYGSVTFNSLAKTVLQLAAAPAMRGRVMALWAVAWLGSTPLGGPIIGWGSETFGARWGLLAGGLPTLAVATIAYPVLAGIDRRAVTPPAPADTLSIEGH
jgi:MFS family permease